MIHNINVFVTATTIKPTACTVSPAQWLGTLFLSCLKQCEYPLLRHQQTLYGLVRGQILITKMFPTHKAFQKYTLSGHEVTYYTYFYQTKKTSNFQKHEQWAHLSIINMCAQLDKCGNQTTYTKCENKTTYTNDNNKWWFGTIC